MVFFQPKCRLSLLYSSDIVLPDIMARREASILNESMASFPQASYDSATRGIQHHPKALHLGSSSVCLRSSVDNAAAPADNPATDTILQFSSDVTEISKAAGLPRAQLGSKMSAGREWSWSEVRLLPISTFTLYGRSPPTHCADVCDG